MLDNLYLACVGVSRKRFSFLRARRNDALMAAAEDLVHMVHLDDVRDTLVAELSYGQQRQLEIAMALSARPVSSCSMRPLRASARRSVGS